MKRSPILLVEYTQFQNKIYLYLNFKIIITDAQQTISQSFS